MERLTSEIVIPKKFRKDINLSENKNQYQEWIARFCYASAKLPPNTVEHILDLMETCGDSESTGLTHKEGNA